MSWGYRRLAEHTKDDDECNYCTASGMHASASLKTSLLSLRGGWLVRYRVLCLRTCTAIMRPVDSPREVEEWAKTDDCLLLMEWEMRWRYN